MDIAVLLILPLLAAGLSGVFHLSYMISTLLFYGLPSLYLSWKRPELIRKVGLCALVMTGPMVFIFDYMAFLDRSWIVPHSLWRFMHEAIAIEDVFWAYLLVYYALMVWEHFFTKKTSKKPSKKAPYFVLFCTSLLAVFSGFYLFAHQALAVPYFYLKMAIVFEIVPVILLLIKRPWLLSKLLLFTLYFVGVNFLVELIGLTQNQWYYDGPHYLHVFNLLGHALPLDEILALWIFAAPSMVAWYVFLWKSNTKSS